MKRKGAKAGGRDDAPAARPVGGRAIGRYARNGSVEACERVHILYGEVRAERDARAMVDDAPERVQAFDALGALGRRTREPGNKTVRGKVGD